MKTAMVANIVEVYKMLFDLTQEIRASTESDTASTARLHVA
jgi:hypothetical protein